MEKGEDIEETWNPLLESYPFGDHYSILWESQYLVNLGTALREFVSTGVAGNERLHKYLNF